eukprot:TRINITY_DN16135_c0_g1_i1.p2 TRINITY_DN16135_c0_g1~~TRINITY_DN16135_c0_g1_i1.p2  ORF type:complete len:103 (+),score=26.75 TRINITY_DN16135_c0_g1_i1:402-710(+)
MPRHGDLKKAVQESGCFEVVHDHTCTGADMDRYESTLHANILEYATGGGQGGDGGAVGNGVGAHAGALLERRQRWQALYEGGLRGRMMFRLFLLSKCAMLEA